MRDGTLPALSCDWSPASASRAPGTQELCTYPGAQCTRAKNKPLVYDSRLLEWLFECVFKQFVINRLIVVDAATRLFQICGSSMCTCSCLWCRLLEYNAKLQ